MHQKGASVAVDMRLEEIEGTIAAPNREGAEALATGKCEIARDHMDRGSQMASLRGRVKDLQTQWLSYVCCSCASEGANPWAACPATAGSNTSWDRMLPC